MAEVIPTVPEPTPTTSPPKKSPDPATEISKSIGASRTLLEYVLSFAQKRLALVCFGVWKLCEIQLATQESDAVYAAQMAGHWKDLIAVYVISEAFVKAASVVSLAICGKKQETEDAE